MTACDHATWLQLAGSGTEFTISDTGRLRHLMDELPRPSSQYPSLCLLQGRKGGIKDTALRYLFSINSTRRNRGGGIANIRADCMSFNSDHPIFIADCNLEAPVHPLQVRSQCHPTTAYPITWDCLDSQTAIDITLSRIILPLCSVFIIFVEDFENTEQLLAQFTGWKRLGVFSDLPASSRPRLILAYSSFGKRVKTQELRQITGNAYVRSMFPNTTIFPFNDQISESSRFQGLKDQIKKDLDLAKASQERSHLFFAATHLCGIYEALLPHATRTTIEAFDAIEATRTYMTHEGNLQDHILEFLQAGVKYATTYDDATTHIASSLFMDAYPVGCHRE